MASERAPGRSQDTGPNAAAWDPWADALPSRLDRIRVAGIDLRRGSRVRLAPARRADILDMALAGHSAVIEAIEQDLEGRIQVAVIVEADPGRELGAMRQPGHRFFFAPEELQPLEPAALTAPRILLAGIGNIFLGDDGFGVALAQALSAEFRARVPDGVEVRDFGIRGFDLAMALLEPWDRIVLLDAAPRGGAPGTVYWEQISVGEQAAAGDGMTEPHALTPVAVLRLAAQMGSVPATVWLAGCEPSAVAIADAEPQSAQGLSPEVAAAVPRAAALVRRQIEAWQLEARRAEAPTGANPDGTERSGNEVADLGVAGVGRGVCDQAGDAQHAA